MSTYVPGFESFFRFLHHFILAKLATSNIRVKCCVEACNALTECYQMSTNVPGFQSFFMLFHTFVMAK